MSVALVIVQEHTAGPTVTVADASNPVIVLLINPATLLAGLTATMPLNPLDDQAVEIRAGGTITSGAVVTTLTVSPNTGQTILEPAPPTTINTGDVFSYRYRTANTSWYRDAKQATLVSGTNIKSINGTTLLGSGDLIVGEGGGTGDVVGPASAVNNRVVFFDGTTGKLIKDSGLTLSGGNTGDQDISGKQDVDADLTAIAGLSPTNDDILQRKSGAWANRTIAQYKTDLTLVKGDVGLSNVDNTADTAKPVSTAQQTALDAKQATLVSGTNIKSINGTTLLGSGDLTVSGGGGVESILDGISPIRSQQTTGLPLPVLLASVIEVADDSTYNAYPTTMFFDRRGRLHVYYLSGASHTSTTFVLKQAISANGGATWVTATVPTSLTGVSECHGRLMSNGKIGLAVSTYTGGTGAKCEFIESSNDGETFSTPVLIQGTYAADFGPYVTDFFEDRGILYVTMQISLGSDTRTSTILRKSSDFGLTWGSGPITVASTPGSVNFNEARMVRYRSSLVMFIRDESSSKLWRSPSTDAGETWGARVDVTPPGWIPTEPDPIVIGDMLHMMYRSTNSMSRAVSYDGGLTWNASEVVETSVHRGFEYGTSLYDNGLILVAYSMDRITDTNADVKILQFRYGTAVGLDGKIASDSILVDSQSVLTYAATTNIDFNQGDVYRTLALTGNVTLTTSNKAAAKSKVLIITADATRTFTFPAWTWLTAVPASLVTGKTAVLSLYSSSTTEGSVLAAYVIQP